jgi:dihydrofolate reductase
MGKVILGASMSLDGFINDSKGHVDRLYPDLAALRQTEELQESIRATGAVVMGKRAYLMAENVGVADYEYQVPLFILTHKVPTKVIPGENDKLKFVFVMDGIESAIAQAKLAAGEEKNVTVVGGASTTQQCIKAGLFDEIHLYIMPVLLGEGLRLFEHLGRQKIELEKIKLIESATNISIQYRVVK